MKFPLVLVEHTNRPDHPGDRHVSVGYMFCSTPDDIQICSNMILTEDSDGTQYYLDTVCIPHDDIDYLKMLPNEHAITVGER